MALRALWQSDAERALPITEKILNGSDSPKYKANVLSSPHKAGPLKPWNCSQNRAWPVQPRTSAQAIEYLSCSAVIEPIRRFRRSTARVTMNPLSARLSAAICFPATRPAFSPPRKTKRMSPSAAKPSALSVSRAARASSNSSINRKHHGPQARNPASLLSRRRFQTHGTGRPE